MDVVKVFINLNEGTLQLEGSQQFVEKYLDKYHPMIQNLQPQAAAARETVKEAQAEGEKVTPKRTRTVRPKTGPTCSEKIRELISEGFFKEQQRTRSDVQKRLQDKGFRYESGVISACLSSFFKRGELNRTGVGRNARYYSNV